MALAVSARQLSAMSVGRRHKMAESKRPIQIPVEGSSGRVPSGALQFRDDWPGLWLRGDDAHSLLLGLERMCDQLREYFGKNYRPPMSVGEAMATIRRDVIVRAE